MTIRKFNKSYNSELLKKYDFEGLKVSIFDKYFRKICNCGNVFNGDDEKCTKCGNSEFKLVTFSFNRFNIKSVFPPTILKGVGFNIINRTSSITVNRDFLRISFNGTLNSIIFDEVTHEILKIDEVEIMETNINTSLDSLNATITFLKNLKEIKDCEIKDKVLKTVSMLSGKYVTFNENEEDYNEFEIGLINKITSREFEKIYNNVDFDSEFLNKDTLKKYYGIIMSLINYGRKINFHNEDEFLKYYKIPKEIKNILSLQSFNSTDVSSYYKTQLLDDENYEWFENLEDEKKLKLKTQIEYGNISSSSLNKAFSYLIDNPEQFDLFIKYSRLSKSKDYNLVECFKSRLEEFKSLGLDINEIHNDKLYNVMKLINLMEHRKFPSERIDAFVDLLDIETMKAFELITSKAKLKEKELKMINKKI